MIKKIINIMIKNVVRAHPQFSKNFIFSLQFIDAKVIQEILPVIERSNASIAPMAKDVFELKGEKALTESEKKTKKIIKNKTDITVCPIVGLFILKRNSVAGEIFPGKELLKKELFFSLREVSKEVSWQ
jgi:hypothetical protein